MSGLKRIPLAVAIGVAVVGVVLAVVGLIAGGPDQAGRDAAGAEVAAARRELDAAESELAAAAGEGREYAAQAQAILSEGNEFCGCSERGRQFQKQLSVALEELVANPSPVTANNYDLQASLANAEKEAFQESLLRLRSLHAELPEAPGG